MRCSSSFRSRPRRTLPIAIAIVLGTLIAAPVAGAEIRSGSAFDPLDEPVSVDGVPSGGDLEAARVQYDTAGSLTLIARFYAPVSTSTIYDVSWALQSGSQCVADWTTPGARVSAFVSHSGTRSIGTLSVSGFTGYVPGTVTIAADRREVMLEATHPILANRDFRCANAETSFGSDRGYYSAICGCLLYTYDVDEIPFFALSSNVPVQKVIGPPPPDPTPPVTLPISPPKAAPAAPKGTPVAQRPSCSDGVDNDGDGQVDLDDWGCTSINDNDERLNRTPALPVSHGKSTARSALTKRYATRFRRGTKKRLSCSRKSATVVRCSVSWTHKKRRYAGSVTMSRTSKGEKVYLTSKVDVRSRALRR